MEPTSTKANKDVKEKTWGEQVEEADEQLVTSGINNLKASQKEDSKDEDAPLPMLAKKLASYNRANMNRGKIIVEQDDPNSPIHSTKSFEELNLKPELLKGIYGMGFNKPSKIQETALPILLAPTNPPKNIIAQAQSGTGKTAAFVLNMLSRVDPKVEFPQAICIAPTRELVRQIYDNIKKMGQHTQVQTQLVVKDTPFPPKITAQIVVGTPGKLLDLMKKRIMEISKVKVFVLDEADTMMEKGSLSDQAIQIKRVLPKSCQICLFSATFKDEVRAFAEKVVPQPCTNIRLKRAELTLDAIKQLYIDCKTDANKFNILSEIYGYLSVGQSIIFVHTRKTATELTKKMTEAGHTVSLLHGGEDMSSQERDRVIDDFRDARTKVLITTNVLARGIDILQVMLVINYDLPLDAHNKVDTETYLHRIGRSGRFGRKGIAINFVADEVSKGNLRALQMFFQKPIDELKPEQIETLQPMLEKLQEDEKKAILDTPDEEE
jgi:ATP-dependent RNA helicase DDX19/DBP5